MAMKHAFGTTPWGAYFTEALEALADEGRLSRGRSYAGNEKVRKLEIEAGSVIAKVKGNYQPFYTVRITFPPLSKDETDALRSVVTRNPLYLAQVRAGLLPEEFLKAIKKACIALFPKKWSAMKRSCDCPDYGDPCKHQAAVYYLVAQEIDRDPVKLFRLRGVDLDALLPGEEVTAKGAKENGTTKVTKEAKGTKEEEESGITKSAKGTKGIFNIEEKRKKTEARKEDNPLGIRWVAGWEGEGAGEYPETLQAVESYAALLVKLLPEGPPLAGLDLSTALAEFYHALARLWERPFLLPAARAGARSVAAAADDDESGRDAEERRFALSPIRFVVDGSSCRCVVGGTELSLLDAARKALACDLPDGSPGYAFLRRFSMALRSIVAAGAIHPVVVRGEGGFSALWKPADFGTDVRAALSWVEGAAVPPEAPPLNAAALGATRETAGAPIGAAGTTDTSEAPKRRGRPPKKAEALRVPDRGSFVRLMAASFLRDYVTALRHVPAGAAASGSPVAQALFDGRAKKTDTPSSRSLPDALASRLAVYDLASGGAGFELAVASSSSRGEIRYKLTATVSAPNGARLPLHKAAAEPRLLAFPALLANFVPGLGALGGKASVVLTEDELSKLVTEAAPSLARIGVSVVLPRELSRAARPKPVLTAKRLGSGNLSTVFDLGAVFDFQWKIALGGITLDPAEFSELVGKGGALCRFKGMYVRVDAGEAAAILERIRRAPAPDALGALKAALDGDAEPEGDFARAVEALVGGGVSAGKRPIPQGLSATLRHYQERGYRWILDNLERGFGCLLADDMGLGKTLQAIAAALALKEAGRLEAGARVVAPASLLANWERELSKFAPSLKSHAHYGAGRKLKSADVVLTTYETYARDKASLGAKEWDLAVLDEAHLVKNPDTKRSKAVKAIRASRRLALTGTPVENNLAELWSVMDFALPGFLGKLDAFAREFRRPIEVERSKEAADRLKRVTAPFILRRLKTDKDIAPDLPDKIVVDEYATLSAEQVALYQAAVEDGLSRVSEADGIGRRGLVLALVTALKQISNHPRNWDKESPPDPERSGKTRLLLALLSSAFEAGERVLVFSQYVEMLNILDQAIRNALGVEPYVLHGGMSAARRDDAVRRFQGETGPGVFLVSLKAGGVGLNLTAATRVFHYDLWYNPAVEAQATDRAFRIGQTKNVFVHRLIARGTLDEKIDAALARKRELADLAVGTGEKWITELPAGELRELLSLSKTSWDAAAADGRFTPS